MLRFFPLLFCLSLIADEALNDQLSQAQRYLTEGKPALAIEVYRSILARNPESLEAHVNLGVVEFFQGNCLAAAPHFQAALRANTSLAKVRGLLGICQQRSGQTEEAERNLSAAYPGTTDLKAQSLIAAHLVELLYHLGTLERANTVVEDQLGRDPANIELLYMAYRINTELADRARNAIAIHAPDSARMHQLMAERFVNDGDASNAIAQYEKALILNPSLPGVHYELGEALLQDSRAQASMERAVGELGIALKENPENAGAEAKLGRIAADRNQPEDARKHFMRAIAIQPTELEALEGMAKLALLEHRNQQAVELLLQATQVNPLDEGLHYRLAQIYRTLGKREEERSELTVFEKIRSLKKKSDLAEAASHK